MGKAVVGETGVSLVTYKYSYLSQLDYKSTTDSRIGLTTPQLFIVLSVSSSLHFIMRFTAIAFLLAAVGFVAANPLETRQAGKG